MKKLVILLGILCLIPLNVNAEEQIEITFENNIYITQNKVEMTKEEVDNLRNLAFSNEQIALMDQTEFDMNKDLVGEIVSSDTLYIKSTYFNSDKPLLSIMNWASKANVTVEKNETNYSDYVLHEYISENEYNNKSSIPGISLYAVVGDPVSTNMKRLTTDIIKVNYNGSTHYRYRNDLHYKNMPSVRSNDLFGIRIDDSHVSVIPGTEYAKLNYSVNMECAGVSSYESNTYSSSYSGWKKSSTGYALTMPLPKDKPCAVSYPPITGTNEVDAIDIYMYFTVQKKDYDPIKTLNAYGSYQHSTKTVSFNASLEFSIGVGGLGGVFILSPNIEEKYDGMRGTHVALNNVNW